MFNLTPSIRSILVAPWVVVAIFALVIPMGLGGCDGAGGEGASGDCAEQEAMLTATTWVTPENASPAKGSTSYNLTTFHSGGGADVEMHDSGYTQNIAFEAWSIASTSGGSCDKILLKNDGAWLTDYSRIITLTSCSLELEATDGTYYGSHTKYASMAPTCGNNAPTCGRACESKADCDGDQLCLYEGYVGSTCQPPECQECNDMGNYCHLYTETCTIKICSPFLAP